MATINLGRSALPVLGAALVGLGSTAGYMLARPGHGADLTDKAARLQDEQASPDVPAELAGATWVRGDCSGGGAFELFENGQLTEFNGFSNSAGRYKVKYAPADGGWKVVRERETDVYALDGDQLKLKRREVAGEAIVTPEAPALNRCSVTPSVPVEDDNSPPPKEPLRYALWMAISLKDARAVERIVARMPSIEGGINWEGDPNVQPDIDTMASTATSEIYQIIQKKRGKQAANGKPEDPYAVPGHPWETVSHFPEVMQAAYRYPGRAGGCSNPLLTFHDSSVEVNALGNSMTRSPARIAVSGNRVFEETPAEEGGETGGGVVYEIQSGDGSLKQLALLMPSGAVAATSKEEYYPRCSPMTTSASPDGAGAGHGQLEAAQAAYVSSSAAIASAWQSLPADSRQRLLPSQRAWIKEKTAYCRGIARQTPGSPDAKETARLQCEVKADRARIAQLS